MYIWYHLHNVITFCITKMKKEKMKLKQKHTSNLPTWHGIPLSIQGIDWSSGARHCKLPLSVGFRHFLSLDIHIRPTPNSPSFNRRLLVFENFLGIWNIKILSPIAGQGLLSVIILRVSFGKDNRPPKDNPGTKQDPAKSGIRNAIVIRNLIMHVRHH